jgi:hypothetical protein
MNAEAVLKQRVRNEQTSGEKKSPSKGVIIFYFFPAQMQIFRPIGQTFGRRRERVKPASEACELSDMERATTSASEKVVSTGFSRGFCRLLITSSA